MGDDDLVTKDAAGRIHFLDREVDAVLPVRADRRAAARQFRNVGDLDVLGVARSGEDESEKPKSCSGDCFHVLVLPMCDVPFGYAALASRSLFAMTASKAAAIASIGGLMLTKSSNASAA